ncbi:MAG TPA: hypothetical protein VGG04_14345 [Candidatus Sulfotelmatobacter sp.]
MARYSTAELTLRIQASLLLPLLLTTLLASAKPGHNAVADQKPASNQSASPRNFDGPAELPREHVASSMRDTPAPGKTIIVRAGEDPSQAVSRASCGDIVELQAGATFRRLVLPQKNCDDSHWIVIRTSAPDSSLPFETSRLTPCFAGTRSLPDRPSYPCSMPENVLARLEYDGKGGSGPVMLLAGANHYRLIGLEITRSDSPAVVYNLISAEKGAADHLVFDRLWVHGTARGETVRGIMLSRISYAAVINSYFSDFHCVAKTGACVDSQAIAGGTGDGPSGPFKIENNYLEAAGECVMFGGGEATATPADIEIRRNHLFKPMSWMKGQPGFTGGPDGNPFIVKNLFELKNGQRVLFENNVLENTWGGFTQTGFAVLLSPKNQAEGGRNVCPACEVLDVTIRDVTISHVASGFQIANGLSDNNGAAKDGGRYSIHNVSVEDIDSDRYSGFGAFAQISTAPGDSSAPRLHDVSIHHVTAFPPRTLFIVGGPINGSRMSGLSVTENLFSAGARPLVSTGGGPQVNCAAQAEAKGAERLLRDCFSSFVFDRNVIVGGGNGWPKDNRITKKVPAGNVGAGADAAALGEALKDVR